MVRRSRSSPGGFRSVTVREVRGAWRATAFLADVLARAGPRADFAAVPSLRALLGLAALRALAALPAFAALRVRATAAVFFRAALFRAVAQARDFARVAPFFLVAAALRLAIT